jgi:hypothetical protein
MKEAPATNVVAVERVRMGKAGQAGVFILGLTYLRGEVRDGASETLALNCVTSALHRHFRATSPQFCYTVVTRTCNAKEKGLTPI